MAYEYDQEVIKEFGEEDARLIDLAAALYNATCHFHQSNQAVVANAPFKDAWERTRHAWVEGIHTILEEIRKAR